MKAPAFTLLLAVLLCGGPLLAAPSEAAPIDAQATAETRNLFRNMLLIAPRTVLFGHQNTLAYGTTWRDEGAAGPDRSDVKDVVGDFPAVYGWDLMDAVGTPAPGTTPVIDADRLRGYVQRAHARGGINSFSWHMDNPVTGGDAWDKTPAVARILPGGDHHEAYLSRLDAAAAFFLSLRDRHGRLIPVWFRPFHEQTGDWFWWGNGHAAPDDYKALWRFTVEYLRDHHGVHNLLYAYSTDVFDSAEDYFRFYPGDEYVDLLGFDDYQSVTPSGSERVLTHRLRMVVRWARERGKLAALTETGLEAIPARNWWTGRLLNGIIADQEALGISYVLVWRNANPAFDRKDHFYAPYPGQKSAADFQRFYDDPRTWFGSDLPNLYADQGG
ncbi:glycoside hydrolase family 26 protein [Porphyrobacter sp. ULC335]|uniref:glycoside hydrolase family 26 protein n=1 Tax=Porphyrobacter sp. ULC335 TaxID=2854260 RepID=UPI00221F04D3|nr:glycoside hydrolase family 26 protein [Porphyrobacter sp. ULC335]UYV15382.1 glycoside hydrolase family 26 protein [Porphyrobacter sp. ULC335]